MTNEPKRDWNRTAAGWKKWHAVSERASSGLTAALLKLAEVEAGSRVLDLATGLGDTAMSTAEVVGEKGLVLATDKSEGMLEFARRAAAEKNYSQITVQTLDLEDFDSTLKGFDAALCRFGLMFVEDLVAALSNIREALVPGGRFAAGVWGPPETAPAHSISHRVLMSTLNLPAMSEGKGTPFALCDRTSLEESFAKAGFTSIESEIATVVYDFKDADEYVAYRRDRSTVKDRIGHLPEAEQARGWAAVAEAAKEYARPDGSVRFVNEAIAVVGQNAVQQYF